MKSVYSDAALILVGHGSTLNADSAQPTYQHADAIRESGLFAEVLEAFWKQEPSICGVLRGVFSTRVFIVPLFISDGYFTEEVIPRELGLCGPGERMYPRNQKLGHQILHYCEPVGTHPSMTEVVLARARDVVGTSAASPPPSASSLFIAGHGTGNNENSRRAIQHHVERIRSRNLYVDVHAIFMEEEPRIADCYQLALTDQLVVVPFFISDGLHSFEDIPVMLGIPEEEIKNRLQSKMPTWINPTPVKGKRVWYSRSIGDEPHLPTVILERVREAAVELSAP